MESIREYLEEAVQKGASDVFVVAGFEIAMKVNGRITPMREQMLMPQDTLALVTELYEMANRKGPQGSEEWDDDFSISVPRLARLRVCIFRQRGSLAAVIRVVGFGIPDAAELGLPEAILKLASLQRGMVLVTGSAGSGKSTTLACLINAINNSRNAHIITIEDPIEYLHRNNQSIVSQREINSDTDSYVTALRASLRQAPDVILIGEMRDLETIQIAMTAAETGHLVFSTLHTIGAANTIDRIIDVFPPGQQQQVRVQLSQVLKTVVSQQLLPTVDGGRALAIEIMHLNNAVRTMVRDSRIHQIDSVIQSSGSEGMIGMDESILRLYKAGRISADTAKHFAMSPDQLAKKL